MSSMYRLKSKNLLFVVPHFKVFIKDQASLIRPYFNEMNVLRPIPYFSSLVLNLPYINKYFRFLELGVESYDESTKDYLLLSPKFFTLPVETLRKRNCYLATISCIKALSKNPLNFNLIHSHFLDNGFVGATLKKLYGKPLVVTAHGGDVYDLPFRDAWHNALARFVLTEADQVITVSRFNAEKLRSLGAPSSKLHVIPNGYNEKLFKPIPMKKAREILCLPLNKKILLSVGNLVDVKGHKYLIDAISCVLKKRKDVILIVVGTGVLRENLEKKARDLGLNDKILFVGRKKHEEIPLWMNACDVFVLPSLSEGFPTVIPEAMACGKPVIASRVGGVPEIITNKEIGVLVNPKDPHGLASAIMGSMEKKWDFKEIVYFSQRYSWNKIVPHILSVYQKIL